MKPSALSYQYVCSEGDHTLEFLYGYDNQRRKTTLYDQNGLAMEKYFVGLYEKEIEGTTTRHINYITAGDGMTAIVVEEEENGNTETETYFTYKDHLGSIVALTDEIGDVVFEQSFDPWGRYRNPSNWSYNNITESPTWLRGYTGHEHLPHFDLVNMNGRVYDPILGRMLSPDKFIQNPLFSQSYNRYSYVWNNPLRYTDPSGDFIVESWLTGFVDGFFSEGSNRFSNAWDEANLRGKHSIKITAGLFNSNPNKNFWGRSWEIISRLTWQAPQTTAGLLYNQFVNTFTSRVEEVEYFHGATFVVGATRGGNAVALGSYISISPVSEDYQANIRIGQDGYTTMHEYGHYIQSQKTGPLYFLKYGLPSALGGADWTEHDANTRAANYFQKNDPTFTWVETSSKYRTLSDEVHNARWFEYPLFFLGGGVGTTLIITKNWNDPW